MAKEFYTVKEFAKEIESSTDRVYEWLRSGHIKHLDRITPHSIYRIPKTEVERVLGRQEVVPSDDYATIKQLAEGTSQTSQKEVGHFIFKAKEEHLSEIRTLIEELKDAIIRLQIDEVSLDTLNPMRRINNNPLFACLSEHLPSLTLWADYYSWVEGITDYLGRCQQMATQIETENLLDKTTKDEESMWYLPPHDYEHLILKRIMNKALGNTVGVNENSDISLRIEKIRTGPHRLAWSLIAYEQHIGSCYYSKLEAALKKLRAASDHYYNLEETTNLIHLFNELRTMKVKIRESLQEILIRRDYIHYTCKMCPGKPRMSP